MIHMKTCLLHRASLHVEHTNLVAVHVFISEHTTLTHDPAVGEYWVGLQGKSFSYHEGVDFNLGWTTLAYISKNLQPHQTNFQWAFLVPKNNRMMQLIIGYVNSQRKYFCLLPYYPTCQPVHLLVQQAYVTTLVGFQPPIVHHRSSTPQWLMLFISIPVFPHHCCQVSVKLPLGMCHHILILTSHCQTPSHTHLWTCVSSTVVDSSVHRNSNTSGQDKNLYTQNSWPTPQNLLVRIFTIISVC